MFLINFIARSGVKLNAFATFFLTLLASLLWLLLAIIILTSLSILPSKWVGNEEADWGMVAFLIVLLLIFCSLLYGKWCSQKPESRVCKFKGGRGFDGHNQKARTSFGLDMLVGMFNFGMWVFGFWVFIWVYKFFIIGT